MANPLNAGVSPEAHIETPRVAKTAAQAGDLDCGLLGQFIRYLGSEIGEGVDLGGLLAHAAAPPSPASPDGRSQAIYLADRQRPFLSIVTRTQARRLDTLREVLLALSGQSCIDYELIIVGHKIAAADIESINAVIDEQPQWVRDRVRFIQVDHGTRAAPLNAGFDAAVGQYIAILDDDDIVLGNWVEVFRDLARESPGSVLRAMSVTQDSQVIHTQFSERSSCTTSPPRSIYPTTFQLVDHLRDNGTPSMTMAFPRSYVSTLGVRFDESLTTAEDWEYLVRAAFVCGVASAPVVTSIYRVWTNRENSSSIHSRKEWVENHGRIHEKHDRTPFLMPPGTTKVIRDILNERDELRACVKRLDEELRWANSKNQVPAEIMRLIDESENVPENVEASRAQIIAILNSTSWKLTSALRAIKRISLGAPAAAPDLSSMSSHELRQLIEAMRHSTSWRITAPIRQSAPLARKLKVKAKRITRRFS